MQEQKINTISYLAIQNTYEEIELALYSNNTQLSKIHIHKNEASKTLLDNIDKLLHAHNLKLQDLNFIGVNKGPAPFTTLRVVITTVNAINFTAQIPLVPVNGLEAFLTESQDPAYPDTVILLNAFNNDVYYAFKNPVWFDTFASQKLTTNGIGHSNIKNPARPDLSTRFARSRLKDLSLPDRRSLGEGWFEGCEHISGCKNINVLLQELKYTFDSGKPSLPGFAQGFAGHGSMTGEKPFAPTCPPKPLGEGWMERSEWRGLTERPLINFIGNAATLFAKEIKDVFSDKAYIPEDNPQTCSIDAIAKIAYNNFKNKENLVTQVTPLYLKDAVKKD